MDEIERRLQDDAARQPAVEPPALDAAVASATRRTRNTLTSLSVAATVALVGGISVAVATHTSGHDTAPAASLAGHYAVDGVLVAQPQSHQLTVFFTLGSCVHEDKFVVRMLSQTPDAVHLAIVGSARSSDGVSASPVSPAPVSGVAVPGSGGPTGPTDAPTGPGDVTGPTGIGTGPTGVGTGPTGIGTGPTGQPTGTTGSPTAVGSAGYSPLNGTGSPGAPAGDCPLSPTKTYSAVVPLTAALSTRPVYVDGTQQVVIDERFSSHVAPPSGYHVAADEHFSNRLAHFVVWLDRAGESLTLNYGPPDGSPLAGRIVSHPDLAGRPATISQASRVRQLTWTLASGAVVQLTSSSRTPMTAAQLLAFARSVN